MGDKRRRPEPSSTNGDAAGGAARSSLTSDQHDRVARAFAAAAGDAEGSLELVEVRAAFEALGIEPTHDEIWDMLSILEKMRGESGRPLMRINLKEFTRLASERLAGSDAHSHTRQSTKGESSQAEVLAKVGHALEAANRRAQTYTEYFMQVLQSEVAMKMETLVMRLHDDNAKVLKQLNISLHQQESAMCETMDSPPIPPRWSEAPDSGVPKPPDIEPAELQWQVLLPGRVPDPEKEEDAKSSDGGSAVASACEKEGPPRPKRTMRKSAAGSESRGAQSDDMTSKLPSDIGSAPLLRPRGKGTLREKAMAADAQVSSTIPAEANSQDGDKKGLSTLQEEKDANRQLFVDAAQLKDRVRTALIKHKYNVKDFYKETGIAQVIARSSVFEIVTMLVVIANSAWIWVDADLNHEDVLANAKPIFQIAEHSFCTYFVFEWTVRFMAFTSTKVALKDGWFCFDSLLVALTVVDTWVLTLVYLISAATSDDSRGVGMDASILRLCRMMRLTRMCRMARLLRYMPELLIILRGLWIASKSVIFTMILMLFVMFVFGITCRQVAQGTDVGREHYDSVHRAMITLFLNFIVPDQAGLVYDSANENIGLAIIEVIYIVVATLTIMNMLVGVLVESVATVSTIENETLMVNMVRAKMLQMIEVLQLDLDGNGSLSKSEFEELLVLPEAAQFIQDVGVDVVGLVEYSDFIFRDREMSFSDFVELILQLRGTNQATVKDVVDLRKQVMNEMETISRTLNEKFTEVCDSQDELLQTAMERDVRDEVARKQLEKLAVEQAKMPLGKFPKALPPLMQSTCSDIEKMDPEKREQVVNVFTSWNRLAPCEV